MVPEAKVAEIPLGRFSLQSLTVIRLPIRWRSSIPKNPLFAATSLPHLQHQFLSLLTLLHAAICTTQNKKGRPGFPERPSGQCSSGLSRFLRPDACVGETRGF
jgi:hypothetical protein